MRDVDVIAADRQARGRFRYVGDGVFDTWRSHADQVLAGDAWVGDCDDLASTVLDLLTRRGLPLDQGFRLLVASDGGDQVDHMVGAVRIGAEFLVVGDTFGEVYPAAAMAHRPVAYQQLGEFASGEDRWRDGAPWAV